MGFLKPFQPAQALYSRTASEEELRQETLVVENTQRPELSELWAHQPEYEPSMSCWPQHMLSAVLSTIGSVLIAGKSGLRTKAERLNVLSSIDLSDVAEPDLLSQWNTEAEVQWHLSDLHAQNKC